MKPLILVFAKEAKERIRHLHPTLKRELRAALDELKENPWEGKILQRELTGFLSLRVKHHRIIYQFDEEKDRIDILTIGPRKTIYENLARKHPK